MEIRYTSLCDQSGEKRVVDCFSKLCTLEAIAKDIGFRTAHLHLSDDLALFVVFVDVVSADFDPSVDPGAACLCMYNKSTNINQLKSAWFLFLLMLI